MHDVVDYPTNTDYLSKVSLEGEAWESGDSWETVEAFYGCTNAVASICICKKKIQFFLVEIMNGPFRIGNWELGTGSQDIRRV